MTQGECWTPAEARAVEMLIITESVKKAARKLGVSRQTMDDYLRRAADKLGLPPGRGRTWALVLQVTLVPPERDVPEVEQLRAELDWLREHVNFPSSLDA